jgi:CRP-like cAMP-binding protein
LQVQFYINRQLLERLPLLQGMSDQVIVSSHGISQLSSAQLILSQGMADRRWLVYYSSSHHISPSLVISHHLSSLSVQVYYSLSGLLTAEVCMPGDVIVREGEIGDEMFFIRHGEVRQALGARSRPPCIGMVRDSPTAPRHNQSIRRVEVEVSIKSKGVVAVKGPSAFFGEIALLASGHRTATVAARTLCELMLLSRPNFNRVCMGYPELQASLTQVRGLNKRDARLPPTLQQHTGWMRALGFCVNTPRVAQQVGRSRLMMDDTPASLIDSLDSGAGVNTSQV